MKRILLLFCIVLFGISALTAQRLPQQVKSLLDVRFSNWKLLRYRIPKGLQPDEALIYEGAKNIFRCNLNNDNIPDYAVALSSISDSTDYFVAIISHNSSYKLFVLDSSTHWFGGLQMMLTPANQFMAIFGDYGREVNDYGTLSPDSAQIKFPIDGVSLTPIIQMNMEETFIFIHDRFIAISTAD